MYFSALLGSHADVGELVALCDLNKARLEHYANRAKRSTGREVPSFTHAEFSRMLAETRPEVVIVTTIDRTHHIYIVQALESGCDVISEKPLTTDAEKIDEILSAVAKSDQKLTVTFNYRYSPRNSKVKELLRAGEIGQVLSVHFEWLLDTQHGADYFRRWHRDKRNSGGLLVHKATHHFDLVNWWLADEPEEVFALGDLRFYGRVNAEARGLPLYDRTLGSAAAQNDPFALDLSADPNLRELYLEAEGEDGYVRDRSVFSDGISIEDTLTALIRYRGGALLSYALNAHCPWEGYRVMFNGSKGRLEVDVVERGYVSGSQDNHNKAGQRDLDPAYLADEKVQIRLQRHWQQAQLVAAEEGHGGHGGGDERMLDDTFSGYPRRPARSRSRLPRRGEKCAGGDCGEPLVGDRSTC